MAKPPAIRKRGHDNSTEIEIKTISNKKGGTTRIHSAVEKENNYALNNNVITATKTNTVSKENTKEHNTVANHLTKLANVALTQQESLTNNNSITDMGLVIAANPITTNNKYSDMEYDEDSRTEDGGEIAMVDNNNTIHHNNCINNEEGGESKKKLYNDYIEHCETIGLSDSLITLAEKARRITRRHGWKDFKLLNDCDFHHTSAFAECMIDNFGWSGMHEDVIAFKWSQVKKDVYQAMQVARSTATQALKKAFLGTMILFVIKLIIIR